MIFMIGTEKNIEKRKQQRVVNIAQKKPKDGRSAKKHFHFFEIKTTSVLYSCNEI